MDANDALIKLEQKLQRIADEGENIVAMVAERHFALFEELNREQLSQGIRSDGSFIEPPYSLRTIDIKRGKGQPTSKVTLFDEGRFYAKIKAKKYQQGVFMDDDDWK